MRRDFTIWISKEYYQIWQCFLLSFYIRHIWWHSHLCERKPIHFIKLYRGETHTTRFFCWAVNFILHIHLLHGRQTGYTRDVISMRVHLLQIFNNLNGDIMYLRRVSENQFGYMSKCRWSRDTVLRKTGIRYCTIGGVSWLRQHSFCTLLNIKINTGEPTTPADLDTLGKLAHADNYNMMATLIQW